jgi:hypothetical protein
MPRPLHPSRPPQRMPDMQPQKHSLVATLFGGMVYVVLFIGAPALIIWLVWRLL